MAVLFYYEGSDTMFEITERKGITHIRLSRGNSCTITTNPLYIDTNENKVYDTDDIPIILENNDRVLFCVCSGSGRKYLTKILTPNDYNDQDVLTLKLDAKDTLLEPHCYDFSFTYFPSNKSEAYTYAEGKFEILPVCGDITDLTKSDVPEIDGDDNAND